MQVDMQHWIHKQATIANFKTNQQLVANEKKNAHTHAHTHTHTTINVLSAVQSIYALFDVYT